MPIKVTCPKCQGVLHAPDDAGGKRGKCPTCGTVLAIPSDSPRVGDSGAQADPGPRPSAFGVPRPPSEPETDAPARGPAFGSTTPRLPTPEPRGPLGPTRPIPNPPQPSNQAGPFAKSGNRPAPPGQDPQAAELLARAWKKARGGLLWMQFAGFFLLLAWVACFGIVIAEQFGVKIPDKNPGYLGKDGLNALLETKVAVAFVPTFLGLLCLLFGRIGYKGLPTTSLAKGLATLSLFATLVAFLGALAFMIVTGSAMYTSNPFKVFPDILLMGGDETYNPQIQRVGLFALALFGLLGELYFHTSLGRMAAHLGSDTLARRGTFCGLLFGFVVVAVAGWFIANSVFAREVATFVKDIFTPQWDKLAEHKVTTQNALMVLAGLVVWFLYVRLIGAARTAIGQWLEQNDPTP